MSARTLAAMSRQAAGGSGPAFRDAGAMAAQLMRTGKVFLPGGGAMLGRDAARGAGPPPVAPAP